MTIEEQRAACAKTQKCTHCGEMKLLTQFYKDHSRKKGTQSWCKACKAELQKTYDCRPSRHKYCVSEKGKKRLRLRKQKERREHPERTIANGRINDYIRAGTLIRPTTCEECGAIGQTQAHHEDYSKPLDVQWLCPPCHYRQHSSALVAAVAEMVERG